MFGAKNKTVTHKTVDQTGFSAKRYFFRQDRQTGKGLLNKRSRQALACFFALTLMFSEYWLLNYCAFPLFDGVSPWIREISALSGGVALLGMSLFARWYPRHLKEVLFPGAGGTLCFGVFITLVGLYGASWVLLALGASLVTIGISLVVVMVGAACMDLNAKVVGCCIASAYFLSYALRIVFLLFSRDANLLLFVGIPFGTLFLVAPFARPMLKRICTADSPAEVSITLPASYLPFSHQVFISLILFRFIYGYTLTFAEINRIPSLSFLVLVPLGIYVVGCFVKSTSLDPDSLFRISLIFSVAGFLAPLVGGIPHDAIVGGLLSTGTGFFEILMYFVLVALAAKNSANALVVLTWGTAMASLGTVVGANFGRLANQYYQVDPAVLSTLSACIVFGLVIYILVIQRNFTFTHTIQSIEPVTSVVPPKRPADFEQRRQELSQAYGLTEREDEIFSLLAQGRNARFIQEKLFISYNTVKTHVSHIYAKLGVHAHQELIDLVEGVSKE